MDADFAITCGCPVDRPAMAQISPWLGEDRHFLDHPTEGHEGKRFLDYDSRCSMPPQSAIRRIQRLGCIKARPVMLGSKPSKLDASQETEVE